MTPPNEITDILTDQERILRAAWMLPNDGTLSEAQRDQAMENFRQYLRQHGIKIAEVARQLGKPRETTILDLMNGVYRSSADRYIRKLNMWVEQHARQRAASLTDKFVTTLKVAKDMLNIARLVRENQTMGLCLGPTGIGKSRCAEAIHEKYVGSIYIRVIDGYHHPQGLTRAIAAAIGVRGERSRRGAFPQTLLERVIDTLRDSSRLLIIDEAHALQDRALELLRDIHDTTGIPILMIATKELYDRIKKNADPDRGQLYSRCEVVHHLTEGYDVYSGGKALHTLQDIRELYNEPPVKLSPDAARYLQSVANMLGYGSLRRCKMLLRNAVRRARKRQELTDGQSVTVTADDLEFVETRLRQKSSERDIVRGRRTRSAGLVSS